MSEKRLWLSTDAVKRVSCVNIFLQSSVMGCALVVYPGASVGVGQRHNRRRMLKQTASHDNRKKVAHLNKGERGGIKREASARKVYQYRPG